MPSGTSNARGLAQEIVSYYSHLADDSRPHRENVQTCLRRPVVAVTRSILLPHCGSSDDSDGNNTASGMTTKAATAASTISAAMSPFIDGSVVPATSAVVDHEISTPANQELTKPAMSTTQTSNPISAPTKGWKEYLSKPTLGYDQVDQEAYDQLSHRAKARLEAFLEGVTLAVPSSNPATNKQPNQVQLSEDQLHFQSLSLTDGLAGFRSSQQPQAAAAAKVPPLHGRRMRSTSSGNLSTKSLPQISQAELVTRLELYIRTLNRVMAQHHECVLAAEPARAMQARTQSLVVAFVDTVSTVSQQCPILTRLLTAMTKELLAVDILSKDLVAMIRRLVLDYEHTTSFASLAFLSSPEQAADNNLRPMVLAYLQHLQANWKAWEASCDLERLVTNALDPAMRHTFQTIEFQSIGHLLQVCETFRSQLQNITLPPRSGTIAAASTTTNAGIDAGSITNYDSSKNNNHQTVDEDTLLRQAIRDLQREVITVNGRVLPPVSSRHDLVQLLQQTLNAPSTLAAVAAASAAAGADAMSSARTHVRSNRQSSRRQSSRVKRKVPVVASRPPPTLVPDSEGYSSVDEDVSSGWSFSDADRSGWSSSDADRTPPQPTIPMPARRGTARALRRWHSFRLSTIDALTRRLLLAASRTRTGGDAYFIVRDLFGGDGIEVVPSQYQHGAGGGSSAGGMLQLPSSGGTIEITVKMASMTIRCHGSFDVYPSTMVGESEPLIQIHTTTSETIALQEVRATSGTAVSTGAVVSTKMDAGNDEYERRMTHGLMSNMNNINSTGDDDDDDDDDYCPSPMILQERITDKTGWRQLSIRPARYERVEVWNTPS